MPDAVKKSPEITSVEPSVVTKTLLDKQAIADKFGLNIADIPEIPDYKKVQGMLDALESEVGTRTWELKKTFLKKRLNDISIAETTDRAAELWAQGIDAVKKLTPQAMTVALWESAKTLKKDIGKSGTEALWAVGEIVNAGSIDGVTSGVTKLSKAINAVSSTLSSAMKWLGDLLSSFIAMLGLDKLWNSIKDGISTLFGGSTEKKEEDKKNGEPTTGNIDKITNLSEIENKLFYDAAWRQLWKINTPYAKFVDPTKRPEFEKILDKYVSESWITDKKALLEKFQQETTEWFSMFQAFSLVKNPSTPDAVWEVAKQQAASKNLYMSLKESGVIKIEISQGKIQNELVQMMQAYGWINASNIEEKKAKIAEKFGSEKYKNLIAEAEATFITQTEEKSLFTFTINFLMKTPGIMWDFIGDIIPWSAISVKAIDGAFYFSARTINSLTTQWFEWALSLASGMKMEELKELDGDKRLLAITMLNQQWHLAFALAGMASRVMTTMAMMPLYWTQGTGISSVKMQLSQVMGDYDSMAKTMNHLTKDLLTTKEFSTLSEFDKALRTQMIDAEAKLHLVDIFKNQPHLPQDDVNKLLKTRMSHNGGNLTIRDSIIDGLVKPGEKSPLTVEWLHNNQFKSTVTNTWWEWFKSQAKWLFVAEQETHAKLALKQSKDSLNAVCRDAIQESKWSAFFAKLKSVLRGDISTMINDINRWQIILHVNAVDQEEQLKALKNVMKEVPSGMQHLFSWLSFVLVGLVAVSVPEDKKIETALQGLLSIHPFGACYVLLTEWTKMKEHQWTNPQYMASMGIAGVFAGTEAISMLINARNIGFLPAIANSAIGPYRVLAHVARWGVNIKRVFTARWGMQAALQHGEQVAMQAAKWPKKSLKAAGVMLGITFLLATPAMAFAYRDGEKMREFTEWLKKKSLISWDGAINWDGVVESAKEEWKEAQENTLKFAAGQYLGDNANYDTISIKDWVVNILLQPSTDPARSMTFGIIDTSEITQMRMIYQKLGYTVNFTYNTDADTVIKWQKEKLSKEWYTPEQLGQLEKQIEWVKPT
jgi:hypothetical protein